MGVIVYTRPGCQPCTATKRKLAQMGLSFDEVAMTPEQAEAFRAQGHGQAPVVIAGDESWSGYRPDLIAKLKEGMG